MNILLVVLGYERVVVALRRVIDVRVDTTLEDNLERLGLGMWFL
jgi:hypothetical protein